MTRETKQQRKTEVKKTIGYGLITAALYGSVFWNADAVMSYFIVIDRIEGSKSLVKIVSETEMPFEKW